MQISIVPVLACTVVNIVIGAIWYSSKLIGSQWMECLGITAADVEDSGLSTVKAYVYSVFSAFLQSVLLSLLILNLDVNKIAVGSFLGFILWVGMDFAGAMKLRVWEDRPLRLLAIDTGVDLINLVLTGGLLAVWH